MAGRLERTGRRARYRLRQQTVAPVIGQIRQARGFRQFLWRGLVKVSKRCFGPTCPRAA